jgi:hypothetical protein
VDVGGVDAPVWTRAVWIRVVVDAGGGARAGQREADVDDEATHVSVRLI